MDIDVRKQMVIMIRALYFQLEEHWAALTKHYKMSTAQQHILYILFTNKNSLSITQISKIGCWHISTVTRLLKPLSEEKYITVSQDQSNNKMKVYEICGFPEESVNQFLNFGINILQGQKGENFVHWLKEAEVNVN